MKIILIALFLLVSCSATKHVERNTKYMDPNCDAAMWNTGLETPDKDIVVFKKEIISHLPLKAGDFIADIGAGTGQFEKGLSEKVGPSGKVYAVEVAPAFIPYMKERFKKENLKNVEVIHSNPESTTLGKESVHVALVIDTYHHFDHPVRMLKDIHKALKSQGHLVIIDFRKGPKARAWVNEHMHLTREDIIREVSSNGFKFIREENIPFKESFQLTFQKQI